MVGVDHFMQTTKSKQLYKQGKQKGDKIFEYPFNLYEQRKQSERIKIRLLEVRIPKIYAKLLAKKWYRDYRIYATQTN